MSYSLVIVESPAKCGKIEQILGPGYKCIASYGHLQQLSSLKDIDISNNFFPRFTPIDSKRQQITKIRGLITNAKEVILATDDDREGEGIAWHICKLFNLSIENTKRIIFHEITETAIKNAIKMPTKLNMNLVNAQQGRQILDLLVGFKISPLLWENISRTKKGLSAGRCQTPALRLIYENQKDIDNSPGKMVYNTQGYFTDQNLVFILNHNFDNEDKVIDFLEETTVIKHIYKCEKPKDSVRKAPQPFTTSSLQQMASNELHISPKETMTICQKLYEGGYITYMRTDSKIYSQEFLGKTNEFIKDTYGEEYISKNGELLTGDGEKDSKPKKKPKKDKENKPTASGIAAHEAIRPTNIKCNKLPDEYSSRETRMYRLIWKNTLESCMADALYKTITAKISAPYGYEYRYISEQVVFAGWKIVNGYEVENKTYRYLQTIKMESIIVYKKVISKVTMKDIKAHYTEAKLVQLLEQKGIGRPSTFSSLIEKIQDREYVKKENIKGKTITCVDYELENEEITEIHNEREFGNEKNKLVIQNIGILVLEFLLKTYDTLFEYEYTKNMENKLDLIAKGNKIYSELCGECLVEIERNASVGERKNKEDIILDANHTYMIGKYGPVIKYSKDGVTSFKSVNKDINLSKLRSGEYKLEEIVQDSKLNRKLGKYKDDEIILKRGQYGLYVVWGEKKRSINDIYLKESDIQLEDVVRLIEMESINPNLVRKLTDDLSIRKGKFGDYIFYKKDTMKKPKFYKLNGFKEDYKTCDIEVLIDWITETYMK